MWVMEDDRLVEFHGQTITLCQWMSLLAHSDIHPAFDHPDLLVDPFISRAGFKCYARSGREAHFDDLNRLWFSWWRDVSPNVSRPGIFPLRLIFSTGHRTARSHVARLPIEQR